MNPNAQQFEPLSFRFISGLCTLLALSACSGGGASAPPPAPTATISASASDVRLNGSVTLTWSSTNASSCSASGDWSGNLASSGSQAVTVTKQQGNYSVTCAGGGGATSPAAVIVRGWDVPTANISASVSDVRLNGTATLTWSSTNASSCTASGDWNGNLSSSGSQIVTVTKQSATYTVGCTGIGGSTNPMSVTVRGWDAPSVTVAANPTQVLSGSTTQISWTSTNASTCTGASGLTGALPTSGSQSTAALTANTTFTIQCTNPVYTTPASGLASVSVNPSFSLTVTALADAPGSRVPDPVTRYYVPDWANPVTSPIPYVWIELQTVSGQFIAGSYANASGAVTFTNLNPKQSYVPTLKSKSMNENGFDLWVVKNTAPIDTTSSSFRTRYAVYENRAATFVPDQAKPTQAVQIKAALGWDSATKTLLDSNRQSGPYLILINVNQEESLVKQAAGPSSPTTQPLTVLWSTINTSASAGAAYNFDKGLAGFSGAYYSTSHRQVNPDGSQSATGSSQEEAYSFAGGSQKDELTEMRPFSLQHEFFHHVQWSRLRFYSPGGAHDRTNYFDHALAYSEGLADALPSLLCKCSQPDDIYYWAPAGQIHDYGTDISGPITGSPVGWFQETTIARLLWSLLDSGGQFKLTPSEVLAPLFTTAETSSRYMPTIWSYAKQLKTLKPSLATSLNTLGNSLNINLSANDEYGTNETHLGNVSSQDSLPIFTNLTVGGSATVCSTGKAEDNNKLGNMRYLRISVPQAASYSLSMTGPTNSRAWFTYQGQENNIYTYSKAPSGTNSYSGTVSLVAGDSVVMIGDCSVNNTKAYCGATSDPPTEQCWTISLK